MNNNTQKTDNKTVAIETLKSYCAYQERCISDVKLYAIKKQIPQNITESAILILIDSDYLNENRFAQSFTRGKFSQNKWGKVKIKYELLKKGISETLITKALEEINDEEYNQLIEKLIIQKINKDENLQTQISKIIQYLISKGFEYELVKSIITEIQKQNKK